MANEKGNFRLPYYEKCGFRGEEKKSLEIILKDKPLDKIKLQKFCVGFTVPAIYRNLVWKLLLEVIPVYTDSHEFVMEQRNLEYKELVRALQTMRIIDACTPKTHVFYAAWLLQSGRYSYEWTQPQQDDQFIMLAHVFLQHFDNEVDIYWLTKYLYEYIIKYKNDYPKLIDRLWSLLEKEDKELFLHLQHTGLQKAIPIGKWFDSCFAGILNENPLAKIWDKICGGSVKILIFVTIALLTIQRHELLKCTTLQTFLDCLKNVINIINLNICCSITIFAWFYRYQKRQQT